MPQHKHALITGSAKRLGREFALFLAKKGYNLTLHYHHSEHEAKQLQKEVEKENVKSVLVKADLTQEKELKTLIKQSTDHLGTIHLLLNNASSYQSDTLESFTKASWDSNLYVNSFAPLYLAQYFAKQLGENEKGMIVNLTDSETIKPRRQKVFTYELSKSIMHIATEMLAQQLGPHIRVNAIAPGPVLQNAKETDEYFLRVKQNCPLAQGAEIDDLLQGLDYLLHASAVTGVTLPIDGGKWLK